MGIEALISLDLSTAETPKQPLQINAFPEQDVLDAVSRHLKVEVIDMVGRDRDRVTTYARHMAMFILKNSSRESIADIGRKFGNRDHSTVISAIAKIDMWLQTGDEIAINDHKQLMEALRENLTQP